MADQLAQLLRHSSPCTNFPPTHYHYLSTNQEECSLWRSFAIARYWNSRRSSDARAIPTTFHLLVVDPCHGFDRLPFEYSGVEITIFVGCSIDRIVPALF